MEQIDYKEKYEQAMERARQFFEKPYLEDSAGIVGYIFPELKEESEDERIRKALKEYFINSFQNNGVAAILGVHIKDILSWLEKQGEQKPAWSEEDKRKIDRIYSILRQAADTHAFSISCRLIGDKECIELQDFLKSLRPQNRWKPSEEQIHYLSWIANIKLGDSVVEQDVSKHLNELLEDLKKLREE